MRGELVADDQVIVTRDEDRLIGLGPCDAFAENWKSAGLGLSALATLPSVPLRSL